MYNTPSNDFNNQGYLISYLISTHVTNSDVLILIDFYKNSQNKYANNILEINTVFLSKTI